MEYITYDTLSYFAYYHQGIFMEGYDGYRIIEEANGVRFLIYKEIYNTNEVERRFIIPDYIKTEELIKLKEKFDSLFERQKFLFKAVAEVEKKMNTWTEEELKALCEEYYVVPSNYVSFICLNFTKSQFFNYAAEKLQSKMQQALCAS